MLNGETGLLVDPENSEELAKNIIYLLGHVDKAREMGLKGKQFIKENFAINKIADKLQNLYGNVVTCPTSKF